MMKARRLILGMVAGILVSGCAGGKAIEYHNRGTACLERRDCQAAIDNFTKAIEINPRDAEAYNGRGIAYAMTGVRLSEAIDDYTKAIEINPGYTEAYNNRGVAYDAQGDDERAIQDFNKAIEMNASDADAYHNRGSVYDKRGDYDRAISDFRMACELGGKSACKRLQEWGKHLKEVWKLP